MEFSLDALNSNERSDALLLTKLLQATKEVKNKDVDMVDREDQVMQEPETNKISFREMLIGNRSIRTKEDVHLPLEDVHLPLDDEEEITLLKDDVKISLDGPYPHFH